MERHIASKHPEQHREITAKRLEMDESRKRKADDDELPNSKKQKVLHIKGLSLEEVKDACVNMVTVNGRPFAALDDSGFRQILDPILAALGPNVTISSRTIHKDISAKALRIQNEVTEELRGKLIALKAKIFQIHSISLFALILVI